MNSNEYQPLQTKIEIPFPNDDQNIFLICPECRVLVPSIKLFVSKGQALINIKCSCSREDKSLEVSQYIEMLQTSLPIKNKCIRHPKKTAITFCPECDQWLCAECLKYHNQIAKTHLTSSKEIQLDKNCKKHTDQKLNLFCSTCQKSICEICAQEPDHCSHEHSKLDILMKTIEQSKLYEQFLNRKSILDTNRKLKDTLIGRIDEMIANLNRNKTKIETEYKMNETINQELIKFIELLFLNYNATQTLPNYSIINNVIENTFFNIQDFQLNLNENTIDKNTEELTNFFSINYMIKIARQNYKKYECITTLKGHKDYIKTLILLQDGKFASGSVDETIKIWDQIKFCCVDNLIGHKGSVFSLLQLKDGRLVSGSADETMKFWDLNHAKCIASINQRKNSTVRSMIQLRDGGMVSGTSDKKIDLWDITAMRNVASLEGHTNWVISLLELQNDILASGSADETIRLWDLNMNSCIAVMKQHTSCVWSLSQMEDGRLISGAADNTIRVWDLEKRKCIKTIKAHKQGINCITVLQDGRLASAATDKTLKIWELDKSSECMGMLDGHSNCISSIIQLNDGRICSASYDKTIKLWMV